MYKFTNGMPSDIQLNNVTVSLHQIFTSLLLAARNISCFTVIPYSCDCCQAVTYISKQPFQGQSTGKSKSHQKSKKMSSELTKNCSHCQQTRLMHQFHRNKVTHPTSATVWLLLFKCFNFFLTLKNKIDFVTYIQ